MNIVILTVEERLYLPAFFAEFLRARGGDVRAIFMAPLKHGRQSTWQMIRKYQAAFGWKNTLTLARREIGARIADRLTSGRSSGRFCSIRSVARHFGIPCEVVEDVNAPAFHQRLREMKTDLIASVTCPQLFKKDLIALPPRGCLNMHGALLPHYRGLAPSFWMMKNGETRAGVTVFFVNEDIDAGEVVAVDEFPIDPDETLEAFIVRSKRISCGTLLRAIDSIERGKVQTTPLDKSKGSYFGFPQRADYLEFLRRGRRMW
jgi:methionyl-tRNA formyltransferase